MNSRSTVQRISGFAQCAFVAAGLLFSVDAAICDEPLQGESPGWKFITKPMPVSTANLRSFKMPTAGSSTALVRSLSPEAPVGRGIQPKGKAAASSYSLLSVPANTDADYRTPEIQALAAGLDNNVDRIFSWVRTNIRYDHYFGCKKGAQLTYLERSGNDIDQSALLVALFRSAGIECKYVFGVLGLPLSSPSEIDWAHYFGVDANQVDEFVGLRGFVDPLWMTPSSDPSTRILARYWVTAKVGDNWYWYDPSFKLVQRSQGLNLGSLSGYNRTNFLNSLGSGITGSDSITSLNYSGMSNYLAARSTQLVSALRASHLNDSVLQVVGGVSPLPNALITDYGSLPVAWMGLEYTMGAADSTDTLPEEVYSTISITASSKNLTWGPVHMASLRGRRLSLQFLSNKATLMLDETTAAAATGTTAVGTNLAVTMAIDHPSVGDESLTLNFKGGGMYALIYGFDVSTQYVKSREDYLAKLDLVEPLVLGQSNGKSLETLNIMGLQWLRQTAASGAVLDTLNGISTSFAHRFGRVAAEFDSGEDKFIFIDVPMNYSLGTARTFDPTYTGERMTFEVGSLIHSAMEHGMIEQTQPETGDNALSTIKILKKANELGVPIYLANSTNFISGGNVRSQLSGYTTAEKNALKDIVDAGGYVFLPEDGNFEVNDWEGSGYIGLTEDPLGGLSLRMMISGGLNGGYSSYSAPLDLYSVAKQASSALNWFKETPVNLPRVFGADPVDLGTGNFTHERELLTAGEGVVRGLQFNVSYDGGRRFRYDAHMGNGWTHSYHSEVSERADIDGAFGETGPVEMSATLVATIAAIDLFSTRDTQTTIPAKAKYWLGAVLASDWLVEQLKASAVAVFAANKTWQFHKQPDGTFTSPPGTTVTLVKNGSGNYEFKERHGDIWRFNSDKKLAEIEDLWGKKATLSYYSTKLLHTVTDAYGRVLTFNYSQSSGPTGPIGSSGPLDKGNLVSVTDNSVPQRTVGFLITTGKLSLPSVEDDGSGALTAFTDPEGKADRFFYAAVGPSGANNYLLTAYKNHDNETIVANQYDDFGRVIVQDTMGDVAKRWTIAYAPGQTSVTEPNSTSPATTIHFFDSLNREVRVKNALGHNEYTVYDNLNRIVENRKSVTDADGNYTDIESTTYDARNNVLTETDSKGGVTTYNYDSNDNVTSIIDKRGHSSSLLSFNAQFQPGQVIDREGKVTSIAYKPVGDIAAGKVASVTEGGFTTSFGYDSNGTLNSISYPGGASESRSNNPYGDPLTKTDALGRQTTFTYNKRREVLTQTSPGTASSGSRTTTTSYSNNRKIATVQNPRGFTTTTTYSATGKLLATTFPGGAVTSNQYNTRDQIASANDPLNKITSFTYDAIGRTATATDPLSRTVTSVYRDGVREVVTRSPAPLNIESKTTTDSLGQVVRSEDGLQNFAVPGYDNNGNKTSWKDRKGKTWNFTFDDEDRQEVMTSPLTRTIVQGWNARGLLGTITEPSLQTTTLGYDGRKRLTSKSDPVGVVTYGLDDAGQLLTITEGTNVLTRSYHPSGQVSTYTNASGETIGYDYDKNGNLVSLTYPAINDLPAATVTYTYDARDRLSSIKDWAGRVTTLSWDDAGRLIKVSRPNGTKRALRWDDAGQFIGCEERPAGGAPIVARSLVYDSAGRLAKRLSYPSSSSWTQQAWTAVYDDDNRIANLSGNALSYDVDGNLLGSKLPDGPWGSTGSSVGASGSYVWNSRNQLVRVTRSDNGQQIEYVYDSEGNLIRTIDSLKGTTRWIVDPNGGERSRVLAKVSPDGRVTRYIYGSELLYEIRNNGEIRCYHYDQVGSTVALTNGSGVVVGTADYGPYGKLVGGSGELSGAHDTPFLFVGAYGVLTDEATGMSQMRARWYSPYIMRFLSEDPMRFAAGENFYAYAAGNPLSLIDPSGFGEQLASFGGQNKSWPNWGKIGSGFEGKLGIGLGLHAEIKVSKLQISTGAKYTMGVWGNLGWNGGSYINGDAEIVKAKLGPHQVGLSAAYRQKITNTWDGKMSTEESVEYVVGYKKDPLGWKSSDWAKVSVAANIALIDLGVSVDFKKIWEGLTE
jgi:RHS repeat-associated protein